MSYGLLLLRVVVGGTMAGHGAQKLLGWFDGPGLDGVKKMLGSFGFRWPALMALGLALTECSGLLFALGFLTPLVALGWGRGGGRLRHAAVSKGGLVGEPGVPPTPYRGAQI